MRAADYERADIDSALAALPLEPGDITFIHSNIGFFGRLAATAGIGELCTSFLAAIFRRLGPGGTVVVPTFTYSFPRGEIFDIDQSVSGMGAFAEWVRRHPGAMRSRDPCYSVAALGARAEELTRNAPVNSFGAGSFFQRFGTAGGKVLNLNFDAGSTYLHYVERELHVPYRFDKSFAGIIRQDGVEHPATSTIWVAYRSECDALEAAFEPFDELARASGKFVTASLGRGEIGVISAPDIFALVETTLPLRPWFLTRAETLGIDAPRIVPEA